MLKNNNNNQSVSIEIDSESDKDIDIYILEGIEKKIKDMTYDNLTDNSKKIQDSDEEICCHICCLIMINPIEHNLCGKVLCSDCVNKICCSTYDKSCPFCKQNMTIKNTFYSKRLQQKIQYVQVKCPNNNCTVEMPYCKLKNHLLVECLFETTPCTECKSPMHRLDLENHITMYCVKKQVLCQYCNKYFSGDKINKHYELCDHKYHKCPYKCGLEAKLMDLENHILNCPEKFINCPFKESINCSFVCKLKDIDRHIKDNSDCHFTLALKQIDNLNESNKMMINHKNKLMEDNQALINEFKKYMNSKSSHNKLLQEIKDIIEENKSKSFAIAKKVKELVSKYN